ncbi:MAG TPA: hypothetical protein VK363_08920, partial [Pyrinomonadaceae bacterium]|nr:hypothetical protein [Pyrinomonadaceae bacterium]
MRERAVQCSARSGASPRHLLRRQTPEAQSTIVTRARRNALRRMLAFALASCVSLVALIPQTHAQEVALRTDKSKAKTTTGNVAPVAAPRMRRIASLRTRETTEGARVTVTSDAELTNYTAYESDGRFVVHIPLADAGDDAARLAASLEGRGFEDVQIERRGSDVLLSFKLEAGARAEVKQSFNRLEVRFAMQDAAQQKTKSGSGSNDAKDAQTSQDPVPSIASPSPTPPTPATGATGTASDPGVVGPSITSSDSSNVTERINRAKVTAGKGRSITLPPEKAAPVVVPRLDTPPV